MTRRLLLLGGIIRLGQTATHSHAPLCAFEPPQSDPCRFDVTLSGGQYHLTGTDGSVAAPDILLERGQTYFFDVSTSSNHGFALGTGQDGPEYTVGEAEDSSVCGAGEGLVYDRAISLSPGHSTPAELFYYCVAHQNMGGRIFVRSTTAAKCVALSSGNATNATGDERDGGFISGYSRARVARHDLIVAHGFVMYTAFGLMLPLAAFFAHIGRTVTMRRGSELSLHKLLAPSAVLVGVVGVALAFAGVEQEGAAHLAYSHGVIGLCIVAAALFAQPLLMVAGLFFLHRKMGAAIILSGLANIFLGLHLIDVPMAVQLAQVCLLALLIAAYVLYRPQHRRQPPPTRAADATDADAAHDIAAEPSSKTTPDDAAPTVHPAEVATAVGSAEGSASAGIAASVMPPSRRRRTQQPKHRQGKEADAAAATPPRTDPDEAEAALRGALSEAARARRDGVDAALRGCLRRDELAQLIKDILRATKITLADADQAEIVAALLSVGDGDGDGVLQFDELAALLATRGLRLSGGGLSKLPPPKVVRDEDDGAMLPAYGHEQHAHELGRLGRLARQLEDRLPDVFWGTLWGVANGAFFLLHFGSYSCWWRPVLVASSYAESCAVLNGAVRVAKGAGMALNFNCALVVVPMCRRTLTWLRKSLLVRRLVPLDSSYDFHVAIGWTIVFWTAVHCIAHYVNYFSDIALADGLAPTPARDAIASAAGATGHVLLACLLPMALTALKVFRRAKLFHVFIFTHHLFIVFFVVLLVHGNDFVGPNYYKFAALPLTLYVVERAVRIRNTDVRSEMRVRVCRRLPGGVTHLTFDKPPGFSYKPGQWAFIAVPALAKHPAALEYHPFTISSAPHEEHIGFHIRSAGDWTSALHGLAEPEAEPEQTQPTSPEVGGVRVPSASAVDRVIIDGPYGAASQEIFDHEVAVMVGAGIGVTPFASVLKSIKHKLDALNDAAIGAEYLYALLNAISPKSTKALTLKKAYFYWCTRDQGAFTWFGDLLHQIRGGDRDEAPDSSSAVAPTEQPWQVEVCTYITGTKGMDPSKDLGATFLQLGLDTVLRTTGRNLLVGSSRVTSRGTKFERPRWDKIFGEIAAAHPTASVGVFFCGPNRLGADLKEQCAKFNARSAAAGGTATRFTFHTEVF